MSALRTALGVLAVFASPAAAAERIARPAASLPGDGLKRCADGGFALPGSSTCVRLSGTVALESTVRSSPGPARGFYSRETTRGHVAVDVRTPTELGPLRVYTSVRFGSPAAPDVLRR